MPLSELQKLVYRVAEMPQYYKAIYLLYFHGIDVEAAIVELGRLKTAEHGMEPTVESGDLPAKKSRKYKVGIPA